MRLQLFFLVILFCTKLTFSQTVALPTEFQSWNEVQLIMPLVRGKNVKDKKIDKLTMTLSGVMRIGRDSVDLLDKRISANLDFRVNRYLSLQTGVMYRRDENVKNVPRYESRFSAAAVFTKTWRGFTFRDRNMFEHRSRKNRADVNFYRQRIHMSYPITSKKKVLFTPFISEEGNYDLQRKLWSRNEFNAGISRSINTKTTIDVAYVRVDTSPVNVNGLNVILKIKLW